ncbi:hypothetical protein ADL06_26560 [Streptomyces sp. NRRL F-6491]|nr:hypothetical protein ADL06_26560 [Streptomyces sp. NRRL F-6491]KOX41105.1 hypothetical protein ADL08_20385 [Streptomyces sp. NRRL F-6492]
MSEAVATVDRAFPVKRRWSMTAVKVSPLVDRTSGAGMCGSMFRTKEGYESFTRRCASAATVTFPRLLAAAPTTRMTASSAALRAFRFMGAVMGRPGAGAGRHARGAAGTTRKPPSRNPYREPVP